MDAKELRIGNFVTDEFYDSCKIIHTVESINSNGINLLIEDDGNYPELAQEWIEPEYWSDKLFGIPLTEEWLLKFGFKVWEDKDYEIGPIRLMKVPGGWCLDGLSLTTIEYVHQLQNLYFVLRGEELNYSTI